VAKLVYVTNTSLDGYIEDQYGAFDLYEPDDDVFAATTALLRSFGTFLYGRRLYETGCSAGDVDLTVPPGSASDPILWGP
jgi:hypothetical protein